MRDNTSASARRLALVAGVTAALVAFLFGRVAIAETIVIDDSDSLMVFDSILDGFPNLAAFDGVPDFGGNALAVSLQTGVTEERAVIEFPLHALVGHTQSEITGATLTINVDDVLTTFGPGTTFDATAAERMFVYIYAGNGEIELDDYLNVTTSPYATIDTTSHGVVTDSSLGGTGPLAFDVNVTSAIRDALSQGTDFLGLVLTTDDDLSGTSIDNLGSGSTGPPGINGAAMPFLIVEVSEASTTTTTATGTTTSTSTTTTLSSAGLCGDANDDGDVTATDALTVLRAAVSLNTCPMSRCDVDSNGALTAGDALRVLRHATGQVVDLACQPS